MTKRTFSFLCTAIIFILCFQVSSDAIVTDGLVSYWTFDKVHIRNNKLKDLWGDNDGTSFGNPKIVQGKVGDALKFDGEENYLNMTNLGDFGSQLGSSTFEAWIIVGHKNDRLVLFTVRDNCMEWELYIKNGDRAALDTIFDSFAYKFGNSCHGIHAAHKPINISDGNWHHLVFTNEIIDVDNTKKLQSRVYIDGDPLNAGAHQLKQSATFVPFEKPLSLGGEGRFGARTRFYKGVIDEVRIYNRVLTHQEVIQNYEIQTPYSVEPIKKLPVVWGLLKSED